MAGAPSDWETETPSTTITWPVFFLPSLSTLETLSIVDKVPSLPDGWLFLSFLTTQECNILPLAQPRDDER
jgi:hypothetical protein